MSPSSKRWISERLRDPYVKKARAEQYRSRSAYKLLQIQKQFQLIRLGGRVLDLGAAPGGWSQVAAQLAGKEGSVVAVDLREMAPIPGVTCVLGDILEKETEQKILTEFGGTLADVLLSDMAPNATGVASLDHDKSALLLEAVLELVPVFLRPGGSLAVKIFQGRDFKSLMEQTFSLFTQGKVFKPKASRSRSVEVYLVAKQYRGIG